MKNCFLCILLKYYVNKSSCVYTIVVLNKTNRLPMIKFFRKIRLNLLMENKTWKYLKYAIGEIVLVVIGILIVLQINNWNSKKIFRA